MLAEQSPGSFFIHIEVAAKILCKRFLVKFVHLQASSLGRCRMVLFAGERRAETIDHPSALRGRPVEDSVFATIGNIDDFRCFCIRIGRIQFQVARGCKAGLFFEVVDGQMAQQIEFSYFTCRSGWFLKNSVMVSGLGICMFKTPESSRSSGDIFGLLLSGSLGDSAKGDPVAAVTAYLQGILASGRHSMTSAAGSAVHYGDRPETLRLRELILYPSKSVGPCREKPRIVKIAVG